MQCSPHTNDLVHDDHELFVTLVGRLRCDVADGFQDRRVRIIAPIVDGVAQNKDITVGEFVPEIPVFVRQSHDFKVALARPTTSTRSKRV